ncbi:hypothetical protein [Neorhizobium galegae]|uniref:hypothetical protein n=1 Tax=Neorhizobium galegae TaxID=399 RepID=UPI0012FF4ADB|nr:hypothetical protein [Neorhizobium galegae]
MIFHAVSRQIVPLCLFLLFSSCSVVPDTDDVVALDTSGISRAVQCEMRDAWVGVLVSAVGRLEENRGKAAELSREHLTAAVPAGFELQPEQLANWRANNEAETLEKFLADGYRKLPKRDTEVEFAIETYSKVFITLKFVFDMSQTNDVGASIDLVSAVSRGTLTSPIGGSFSGMRQAKLEKAIGTRVSDLLLNRPVIRTCNKYRKGERPENGLYPISGELKLRGDVANFITDNQSGNLIGQFGDAELLTAVDKPPTPSINKTYIFTTTLEGGLNTAKLDLEPRLTGTSVKAATLNLNAERVDLHKLILVMQVPTIGGLTIAQIRNKRENAEYLEQLSASARELRRIEDRDRLGPTEVLSLLKGL